jgi:hypothetical protein
VAGALLTGPETHALTVSAMTRWSTPGGRDALRFERPEFGR